MEVAWQEVPFWLGEEVLKQDCHSTWCWHEGHGVCQRRGSSQDLLLILGEMMNSQDRSSSHGLFQTEGILLLTSTFCYSQLSLICPWVPRPVVSTAVVMFFAPFNLPSEEKLSMAPWKCCFKYFLFVRWYVYVFHLQPLSQWKCLSAVPGSRMALTYHKRSLSISVGHKYMHGNLWATHRDIHSYSVFFRPYESMLLPAWPSGRPGWQITISAWVSGPEDSEETHLLFWCTHGEAHAYLLRSLVNIIFCVFMCICMWLSVFVCVQTHHTFMLECSEL